MPNKFVLRPSGYNYDVYLKFRVVNVKIPETY